MSEQPSRLSTVYCHGLPGSAEELCFLDTEDASSLQVVGSLSEFEGSENLAAQSTNCLHVIGFSLGAMTAIKIAEKYPQLLNKLSLISPAAPLELGDFLPNMAGRAVFQTAMRSPLQFKMLTLVQSVGVRISCEQVIKMMFKGCAESEQALLSEPRFKAALVAGLVKSYSNDRASYRQAVHEYVNPWSHRLENISCSASIHHGDADNWAPIAMAYALESTIASEVKVVVYPGSGHFSTLRKAVCCLLNTDGSVVD